MVVTVQTYMFWNVTPCNVTKMCQRFGWTFCPRLQGKPESCELKGVLTWEREREEDRRVFFSLFYNAVNISAYKTLLSTRLNWKIFGRVNDENIQVKSLDLPEEKDKMER
jgi:hypothetical protein